MKVSVFFTEEEYQREDFDMFKTAVFIYIARMEDYLERVEKRCEAQKEKACNKGVRKQRRNKTVNASKSS